MYVSVRDQINFQLQVIRHKSNLPRRLTYLLGGTIIVMGASNYYYPPTKEQINNFQNEEKSGGTLPRSQDTISIQPVNLQVNEDISNETKNDNKIIWLSALVAAFAIYKIYK